MSSQEVLRAAVMRMGGPYEFERIVNALTAALQFAGASPAALALFLGSQCENDTELAAVIKLVESAYHERKNGVVL